MFEEPVANSQEGFVGRRKKVAGSLHHEEELYSHMSLVMILPSFEHLSLFQIIQNRDGKVQGGIL